MRPVTEAPEVLVRPDGRRYRPVKVTAEFTVGGDGMEEGVMVCGTHDIARARALAEPYVSRWDAGMAPASPVTGWWRLGYSAGRMVWLPDEVKGRAAVWFTEIVEAACD